MIRTAYNNHENQKEVYEKVKDTGISFKTFQGVWQGKSWSNVMPEVFTQENKDYYTGKNLSDKRSISNDELLKYRQYYVEHSHKETYQKYLEEHQDSDLILKERTFHRILTGDVKKDSAYLDVPVYSKREKNWKLKGKPVSTIHESVE